MCGRQSWPSKVWPRRRPRVLLHSAPTQGAFVAGSIDDPFDDCLWQFEE
jgi:hypothetical protein